MSGVKARTSEELLDVAERLMSERGYAATPVSVISKEAGVAVTSLYYHFGSKDGLLARVLERGVNRWFDSLPRWDDFDGTTDERLDAMLAAAADALSRHTTIMRLFFMLALEASGDEVVSEIVHRVRQQVHQLFKSAIIRMLEGRSPEVTAEVAEAAAGELATFAVAYADGCFFAGQLEPDSTDLRRMYADLAPALVALAPAAVARARAAARPTDPRSER